jgi:hypothetical protein
MITLIGFEDPGFVKALLRLYNSAGVSGVGEFEAGLWCLVSEDGR